MTGMSLVQTVRGVVLLAGAEHDKDPSPETK
jgi:hypothetical protein